MPYRGGAPRSAGCCVHLTLCAQRLAARGRSEWSGSHFRGNACCVGAGVLGERSPVRTPARARVARADGRARSTPRECAR
jgi:hypothetical protein